MYSYIYVERDRSVNIISFVLVGLLVMLLNNWDLSGYLDAFQNAYRLGSDRTQRQSLGRLAAVSAVITKIALGLLGLCALLSKVGSLQFAFSTWWYYWTYDQWVQLLVLASQLLACA